MDSASADYTNLFDYDGINFVCLYTSSTPANAIPYEPEPEDPFKLYSPVDIGDTVYAYVGVKQSEDSDELSYLTNRTGKLFFQDFTAFDEKQIWHFEKNSDGTYSVFTYIDDNVNALTFNSDNETLDISSYSGLNTQKFNLYQIDGYFYLNPVDTIYSMGIGSFNSITTSGENNSLKLAFANILGDTNQDYVVDYKDLLNVKKYILGLSTDISGLADVNRDGTIDFLDYIQLNHKIVG
jgi:hypothetical protein